VIQLTENTGFARSVNAGIRAANTNLLLVLNNDTVLEQHCLLKLIDTAESYPDYGFYAAEIREFEDRGSLWSAGLVYSDRGYGNRSGRHLLTGVLRPLEIFGICGAAALLKRSVLDDVGLFNEEFFLYHEDIELSFRHQLRGYRCLYIPGAVIYHHGSATTNKIFKRTIKHRIRNSIITAITCTPSPLLRRYFLKTLWFYARLSWQVIERGYFWCWMAALVYVALSFSRLLSRRKELQLASEKNPERIDALLYRGMIEVNFPNEVVYL
jgi:hypothetical protein